VRVQQQSHPRKDHGGQPGSSRKAAGSEGRGPSKPTTQAPLMHADNPLKLFNRLQFCCGILQSSSSRLCMAVAA
jgi:hypothetical protein